MAVRVVLGVICLVAGIAVIAVGIVRPAGMWAAPKIQNGVKVIGDAGVSALMITMGLAAIGGGLLIFFKR